MSGQGARNTESLVSSKAVGQDPLQERLQEYLKFAQRLAQQAGQMMLDGRQQAKFEETYKSGHELVTSVDIAIDEFLCREIMTQYPEHLIFSEESTPELLLDDTHPTPVWVIDPIDGTVNFAHGLPHVAVSIGVFVEGKRAVGVVEAPFLSQRYWAVSGQGAYCNNEPLKVSGLTTIRNAVVATGFPYRKDQTSELLVKLKNVLEQCQDIRRNGSAALDLCAVAQGVMDAYYESVKPWDMAAGALIAEEAGALVGHFDDIRPEWPKALNGDHLLAATPEIYSELKALLKSDGH